MNLWGSEHRQAQRGPPKLLLLLSEGRPKKCLQQLSDGGGAPMGRGGPSQPGGPGVAAALAVRPWGRSLARPLATFTQKLPQWL